MAGRVAVKFAYDGTRFMGSQRQPGERTAESELLSALIGIGAIGSAEESRFRVASRTDRGVSALGNVFAVDTPFKRRQLLSAINANCRDVYCYAYADVPDNFSPRRAKGRWYRYHLPYRGQDMGIMSECAREFEGIHEFKLFCKPEGKVTLRRLDRVEVAREGNAIVIDLRSREFLRNMVRRVVSAMDQAGQGKVALEEVREALKGRGRSMGLASPEGLFLMDVDHGLDMLSGAMGPLVECSEEERWAAGLRCRFHDALLEKARLASRSSQI